MPLHDGPPHDHHTANRMKSDSDVPIDPSIAQSSPTYPPPYSPYHPQGHEIQQYAGHPPPGMYQQRPEGWPPQYPQHMPGQYQNPATTVSSASPINASAGSRPGQVRGGDAILPFGGSALLLQPFDPPVYLSNPDPKVYSFVPIPGAQQHKRPRRRYEEIERMYKCGWQGCEKAYGTLNHLNAHVTMQSHGQKRTPEGTTIVCLVFVRKNARLG